MYKSMGVYYQPGGSPCTDLITLRSTDLADGLLEGVELGVECLCPGAVDDPALDVRAEVHLDDVVGAEDGLVAGVGRVVRRAVVDRAARREGQTGVQALLA